MKTNKYIAERFNDFIKIYTGQSIEELKMDSEMDYFIESSRLIINELNSKSEGNGFFIKTTFDIIKMTNSDSEVWYWSGNYPTATFWYCNGKVIVWKNLSEKEHKIIDEICLNVYQNVMPLPKKITSDELAGKEFLAKAYRVNQWQAKQTIYNENVSDE